MKNITYLLTITILLSACGGESDQSVSGIIAKGDLEALRAKKNEISDATKSH